MKEKSLSSRSGHMGYLDSARGIAAMMVAVYHYIQWKYGNLPASHVASIIFNGSDAVSFFFVLSGFVLSYKYTVLGQPLDVRGFFVTRIFRLWPAFLVTIILCTVNDLRENLTFAGLMERFTTNGTQFWEEAILPRSIMHLYGAGWTLVTELLLSFFIPFFVLIEKKHKNLIYWLLFTYFFVREQFYVHFVLGVIISHLYYRLCDPSFKQTKVHRYRYLILLAAAVLFSIRHITRLWPPGPTYTYLAEYLGITFFHYTGLASFVFIIALINSKKAQRMLENKVLLFIGKISFGIYLIHWVFVGDIFYYWKDIISNFGDENKAFGIMMAAYLAVTILFATVLHYAIELPFIRMGKRIANSLKPSVVID